MGSHKTAVLAVALVSKGLGVGVMGTLVALRGLTLDMAYITALAVVVVAAIAIVVVLAASENRTVLGRRLTKVEGALQDHKAHDRAAIREVAQINGHDFDTDTGPQPLRRIGQ